MTTLIFWGGIGFLVLLILARVPGINMLLLPIGMAVGGLVKVVVELLVKWLGYALKVVFRAHKDFFEHLMKPEEEFDIELRLRKKEDNY